jgi:hypothetical protein
MAQRQFIANQLKEQLLNMIDDVIEICPGDYELIFVRGFLDSGVSTDQLMENFIEHVHPWRREIKTKDEAFFRDNDHIFGMLPSSKVKYFKELWFSGHFQPDDKAVFWDYFSVFIDLIDAFQGAH